MSDSNFAPSSLSRSSTPKGALKCAPLRAGALVQQYLEAEFSRPEIKTGTRLPTVRELAGYLKVSPSTVQSVFRKLTHDGRIQTRVGNGTYLVSRTEKKNDALRIALGLHLAGGSFASGWMYRIAMGVLQAASQHRSPRTSILPLSHPSDDGDAVAKELLDEISRVDGVILFPFARREEVSRAYEESCKPAVTLTQLSAHSTANFIGPDVFDSAAKAAKAWADTGRRRIALVGFPMEHSASAVFLYAGLAKGAGARLDRTVSCRMFAVNSWVEEQGFTAARAMLARGNWRPDAIYCVGDYLALGVVRALREAGIAVPKDVSVIGGTGLDLSGSPVAQLTRTQQPLEKMGEKLLRMLSERIARGGQPMPGALLECPFIGGATTRQEENELLGITGHEER